MRRVRDAHERTCASVLTNLLDEAATRSSPPQR